MTVTPFTKPPSQCVVIVDPRLDDYQMLVEPIRKQRIRLTLTSTGSGALRLVPSFSDALWLVTPQLPDMNGLDLLEMLQSLRTLRSVVVVDCEYSRPHELRALQLRATQYVCKPLQVSWLDHWLAEPLAPMETVQGVS
jgi:DNA-binding response OmpR family regulator